MLKSKIHPGDGHPGGSPLRRIADRRPGPHGGGRPPAREKVDIIDIDNGARLGTYVIEGPSGSGIIGVNGAAARLIQPGDLVIITAYDQTA